MTRKIDWHEHLAYVVDGRSAHGRTGAIRLIIGGVRGWETSFWTVSGFEHYCRFLPAKNRVIIMHYFDTCEAWL